VLRIIGITALVAAVGAVAGAAVGGLIMGALLQVFASPEPWNVVLMGIVVGSAIGGALSPVTTWLFLRRVPLWRASVETGAAATLGFILTQLLSLTLPFGVLGSVGFALLAAARLKFASRRRDRAIEAA